MPITLDYISLLHWE